MEDATLFDELAYYIGEDDAETVMKIISQSGIRPRILHVKGHYVLELSGTLTPKNYALLTTMLARKFVSIPPIGGRATYMKIASNYAVIAIVEGMKFYMIVSAKAEEAEDHEAGNDKNA